MQDLRPRLTHAALRRAVRVPVGAAALAVCVSTASALAAPAKWNGALDHSAITKLSFQYTGSRITNFKVPYILCSAGINGEQNEMLYVPTIPVHGGRFATTFHVLAKSPSVLIKVSGRIHGNVASGTVTGQGVCETQPQPFHANPGAFKPVAPPKPRTGDCTVAGCLASDGMFIKVTAVDRTIKSVEQPQGLSSIPADPVFQNGGVGVTVTMTDRSFNGPAVVAPAIDFQLRLGSGVLVEGGGPNGTVVSGNGATYPCAYPPFAGGGGGETGGATLTQGASFGPTSVCFGAATVADRQNLTLYYARGHGPVDAKIPLG